jgi:hypothetical protein
VIAATTTSATTSAAMTRRVPPSTVSAPITPSRSAAQIRLIETDLSHAQTAMVNVHTTLSTSTTTDTRVATTSRAGATVLPCQATAKSAPVAEAKLSMTIIT